MSGLGPDPRGVPRGEAADAARPHSTREGGKPASGRDRAGSDGRGGPELDPGPAPSRPASPAAPPPSPTSAARGYVTAARRRTARVRVSRVTRRRGVECCQAVGAGLQASQPH
ncbi:proline and serine-rich protein 2-like [Mustela erminea]|uniref:proline and serine-rich protein 2-like n=1 Tax=Mustela erminea TaxID=36723 RepID=UPI001387140D|nr:proline and serine-rich protein 2-like [Mustela erminea]